jgi:hypothetical protein
LFKFLNLIACGLLFHVGSKGVDGNRNAVMRTSRLLCAWIGGPTRIKSGTPKFRAATVPD